MRIAIACLVTLFPVLAFASTVVPQDKYLDCNCHITPGLPWKPSAPVHSGNKPVVHHHKSSAKSVTTTPHKPRKHHAVSADSSVAPYISPSGYPGREGIISSNKLALPAGKSIYAEGQLVYIEGRVLDMKCVPVSDAIVEIWQTDTDGHYVRPTLGQRLSPFPTFTGSGRATTDNLGRFNFVTVFPGTLSKRAPFIHVHVIRKGFPTLDTEMFFANDRRNAEDPVFSSLSPDQQAQLTAKIWQRDPNDPTKGLGASWDVSLHGKNPWRHF